MFKYASINHKSLYNANFWLSSPSQLDLPSQVRSQTLNWYYEVYSTGYAVVRSTKHNYILKRMMTRKVTEDNDELTRTLARTG